MPTSLKRMIFVRKIRASIERSRFSIVWVKISSEKSTVIRIIDNHFNKY